MGMIMITSDCENVVHQIGTHEPLLVNCIKDHVKNFALK